MALFIHCFHSRSSANLTVHHPIQLHDQEMYLHSCEWSFVERVVCEHFVGVFMQSYNLSTRLPQFVLEQNV